ncbi:hypothetical protein LR48_Vigan07g099700 [Vigna angularis]|uniref:Uncharacterized protein n=1 Tax=Phaseolus angularis TaxID=3914 RepID=A0A0L9UWZ8_PHAAN|nr:hypothetical protein LR48_Vigan07g099700 [Vigna angularis]
MGPSGKSNGDHKEHGGTTDYPRFDNTDASTNIGTGIRPFGLTGIRPFGLTGIRSIDLTGNVLNERSLSSKPNGKSHSLGRTPRSKSKQRGKAGSSPGTPSAKPNGKTRSLGRTPMSKLNGHSHHNHPATLDGTNEGDDHYRPFTAERS